MKFQKFAPLTKIEEQTDGTLLVHALITAQQPDLEKEVCDYASTKEFYAKRAAENLQKTSIPGMTPSVMPVREMHQLKAIGAGRSVEYNDATKSIHALTHIVEPTAVLKFRSGVLIGFSQGGDYVKKWADPDFPGCTRYTADPFEWSAVDAPCLPSALVDSMKGRTVTLCKAAGAAVEIPLVIPAPSDLRMEKMERQLGSVLELLKEKKTKRVDGADLTADCFAHVGDPDDTSTWKLPIKFPGDDEKTESHIRNALARFEQTEGMSAEDKKKARAKIVAAAKEHGIEVSDEADKAAIARVCAKISLKKGMYEVSWLADIVEGLNWLCLQTEFERDLEDDGSKVPDGLREAWLALLAEFKAMAIEEADELAAGAAKGAKGMKITDQAGLLKAAKSIHEHLEKHMEMHKAHHEKLEGVLAKDHPIIKGHQAMIDHCDKCMKAAKDAMDGEEPKGESEEEKARKAAAAAAAADPITKAITAALAPLTAEIEALKAKLATTPAPQNIPVTGIAPTQVVKSMSADAAFGELIAAK
jgi:hypothetical protein